MMINATNDPLFPTSMPAALDVSQWPQAGEPHRMIAATVRRFVAERIMPNIAAWDEAGEIPRELHREAGSIGLLGMGYPESLGGIPCDALARTIAMIEIAQAGSGGLIAALFTHNIMCAPLLAGASSQLQQRIIPPLLRGERIGALAITEAGGGSDVARIATRAERVGDRWRINGSKCYITSGMRADSILVAARTGVPGRSGISLFLVAGDSAGLSRHRLDKMGWWCSDTAEMYFDDVDVDGDCLVGPLDGAFALIMRNFNGERLFMAANALGHSIACLDEATRWARARKTFGQALIGHQVIRHKVVAMADSILPPLHMLVNLGERYERGDDIAGEIALLKNHACRTFRDCADTTVQILGGSGYMRGGRAERMYREVKVMMIGGGAEEVLIELAARRLGLA